MKENQKKAFDFAADTTKQLITISTAIITLTVTFSKDILGDSENSPKALLIWTWAVFICSIICGVFTLMTLTGTLQPMLNKKNTEPDNIEQGPINQSNNKMNDDKEEYKDININNKNIRFFSIVQALLFITAIIMTGVFGYKSISSGSTDKRHNNEFMVIRKSTFNNDTTQKYIDTLYLPTGH